MHVYTYELEIYMILSNCRKTVTGWVSITISLSLTIQCSQVAIFNFEVEHY